MKIRKQLKNLGLIASKKKTDQMIRVGSVISALLMLYIIFIVIV